MNLDKIEEMEYNNAGALFGIGEDGFTEELLGELKRMNPIKRAKVIQKLTQPAVASKGSRAEMERHFKELPKHVKEQLGKADLRLADTVIFSIKPVTSKTIKIFESSDTKKTGLRSLAEGKLPKNQTLLVSGIILLAGVSTADTDDDVAITAFRKLEDFPALANGEFSLKANKKTIVPEGTSNRVFCTSSNNGTLLGYYKLANTRLIHDDVSIECTIELGSLTGIAAHTQIYVGLHGTITTP